MNDLRSDERALTSALRAIAADDEHLGSSPAVEARVLAEVRSMAHARRMRGRVVMLAAAAAAAAVLFVAIALPLWSRPSREAAVADRGPATGGIAGEPAEVVTEFFPLTYSTVPASGGQVVRMQVPRAALARFGVSAFDAAGDQSPTVMAEVVVGNDGLARAVRFVRAASLNEQQEQKQ